MEAILGLVMIFVIMMVFNFVLSAGTRTVKAAGRTVMGEGSFSENLDLAFKGLPPLEARIKEDTLGDEHKSIIAKVIEIRGLFPLIRPRNVQLVVSLFDVTGDEPQPVISFLEDFQEPQSIVYQSKTDLGQVRPNHGFVEWVRIGGAFPQMLQPPVGGRRRITVLIRMVDRDNPPPILNGYADGEHPGLIGTIQVPFQFDFEVKGYREAAAEREDAGEAALRLGVAVAMADGSLDDREGDVLREWVTRALAPLRGDQQQKLKTRLNAAMEDAYAQATEGELSISALTNRLSQLDDKAMKYEALDLCFDVMAADGQADPAEMRLIRNIASSLALDLDEIAAMRDQRILSLHAEPGGDVDVLELLGIDESWDDETTKAHLRSEFQKWNNRLNSLSAGPERENAQRMIDMIASLRRQYE